VTPESSAEGALRFEHKTKIGRHIYHLAIASTPREQEQGLMYREHLPLHTGMMFPTFPPRPVRFWMKNTWIPLDILFIREGVVRQMAAEAEPCLHEPCAVYGSMDAVDTVIELPGGSTRRDGIKAGSRVKL